MASRARAGRARLIAALLAGAVGCGGGEARDAAPAAGLSVAWVVADRATPQIGASEADALVSVTSAASLPDGGIAVADAGTHRIDVFDARGRRVRTMGRQGRGPGEFTHPGWIGVRGDTLRVWDMVEARLTLFHLGGRLIRTEPPVTDLGSFPRVAGQFADGSLLLMATPAEAWRTGPFRDSLLLVRVNFAAGTRDTLGRVPGDEQVGTGSPRERVSSTRPFGRRTLVAVRGERIYLGTGDTPAILSSTDGESWTQAAAVPGKPQRITRKDIDDYWAGIIVRGSGAGSRDKPPEGIEYPAEYPAYGDLVAAAGSDLWVHLPVRPSEWNKGSRWVVFAGDGSLRGSVYVPGRTRVLEIGEGWILVSETGADDQELVARYSLAPPRS